MSFFVCVGWGVVVWIAGYVIGGCAVVAVGCHGGGGGGGIGGAEAQQDVWCVDRNLSWRL